MMSLKGTGEGGTASYFAKMDKKNKVESKSDKQGME